jgi:hypothetical protein
MRAARMNSPGDLSMRRPERTLVQRAAFIALVVLAVPLTGCSTPFGRYWSNRALDATDLVDLKYGRSQAIGIKAEVTSFLQAGLGGGSIDYTEWFGRTKVSYDQGFFLHMVAFGGDGVYHFDATSLCLLGVNLVAFRDPEEVPEPMPRFRVGAEVLLPFVVGGAYLNFGELVDLFAGFFGADIMGDDGSPEAPADEEAGQNSIGNVGSRGNLGPPSSAPPSSMEIPESREIAPRRHGEEALPQRRLSPCPQ